MEAYRELGQLSSVASKHMKLLTLYSTPWDPDIRLPLSVPAGGSSGDLGGISQRAYVKSVFDLFLA